MAENVIRIELKTLKMDGLKKTNTYLLTLIPLKT